MSAHNRSVLRFEFDLFRVPALLLTYQERRNDGCWVHPPLLHVMTKVVLGHVPMYTPAYTATTLRQSSPQCPTPHATKHHVCHARGRQHICGAQRRQEFVKYECLQTGRSAVPGTPPVPHFRHACLCASSSCMHVPSCGACDMLLADAACGLTACAALGGPQVCMTCQRCCPSYSARPARTGTIPPTSLRGYVRLIT